MKLYVYNYCVEQVNAIKYVKELLLHLKKKGIDVANIEVIDGNKLKESYDKIKYLIEYWNNNLPYLQLDHIQVSMQICNDVSQYNGKVGCNFWLIDEISNKQRVFTKEEVSNIIGFKVPMVQFDKSIVVVGNKYDLGQGRYGVAHRGGVLCINKFLEKKSIWHETAHLLGADDHYCEDEHEKVIKRCGDYGKKKKVCLMQWDSLKGADFCIESLKDIKYYVDNGNLRNINQE